MRAFIVSFLTVFFAVATCAKVEIRGTVLGADGKPCIVAHVHVGKLNGDPAKRQTTECSKDGSFHVTLPQKGNYALSASGVNNQEVEIPLFLTEDGKNITVRFQLQGNLTTENVTDPTIIGDWNKFKFASKTPMVRSADGKHFSYEFTAQADSVSYQLLDVSGSHSMNGSHADYYVYDGGGDYRSVIKTKKGEKVVITFDEKKIRYANAEGAVVKIEGDPFLQKAFELGKTTEKMREDAYVTPPGGGEPAMSEVKFMEIQNYLRSAMKRANAAKDPTMAQYAAALLVNSYNSLFPFDKALAKEIIQTLPPESSFWALAPNEIEDVTKIADSEKAPRYIEQILTKNPERNVKAILLSRRLDGLFVAQKMDEARSLYQVLKKDYGDIAEIKYILMYYNPDAVILKGKPLPNFDVKLIGSNEHITKESMKGKYYLVDFWGTWCGPCIRELPTVSAVYEKFKGKKGFTIISFALDPSEDVVQAFRAKRFPMPWTHTVLTGLFDDDVAKAFQVQAIPKPVLVNPEGIIVASDDKLRGEGLEKTLEKYLGTQF